MKNASGVSEIRCRRHCALSPNVVLGSVDEDGPRILVHRGSNSAGLEYGRDARMKVHPLVIYGAMPGSRLTASEWAPGKGDNMSWYFEVLRKYAVFSGRARRKEYWMFQLFNLIIFCVLSLIEVILRIAPQTNGSVLASIYALAILIPGIAVGVRRLHDTNRSGWWLLIGLVPLIGTIVLIVFMVQDSQTGDNLYGQNPKTAA